MTTHAWPITHTPSDCILPPTMARARQSFEQFYLKKHQGRRLNWQLSLGNADVRVAFKTRTHDLNVATYALVILLLFEDLEDDDTLSYPVSLLVSTLDFLYRRDFRISGTQLALMRPN